MEDNAVTTAVIPYLSGVVNVAYGMVDDLKGLLEDFKQIQKDAEYIHKHHVCSLKLAGRRAHIMSKRPIR
jgi:hypothetical protein